MAAEHGPIGALAMLRRNRPTPIDALFVRLPVGLADRAIATLDVVHADVRRGRRLAQSTFHDRHGIWPSRTRKGFRLGPRLTISWVDGESVDGSC
jgi:hypothetical protein